MPEHKGPLGQGEDAKSEAPAAGLYLVSTPIGNLEDITFRAVSILTQVDVIYAEDTRSFRKLASRYGISTPVRSCYEQNERSRSAEILSALAEGRSAALVSEAGTPTISDPGFRIVSACRSSGFPVHTVPGACAAVAALSVSGFETDHFAFDGFLPQKTGKRRRALEEALNSDRTVIFYESPHRILKTLAELAEIAPQREIALARELTKVYEEVLSGPATEVLTTLKTRKKVLGEYVLLIRRKEG